MAVARSMRILSNVIVARGSKYVSLLVLSLRIVMVVCFDFFGG